jgi:hypothetical protein
LPHKLAIFDNEVVVMPLPLPGEQMRTLLIRHTQLAKSLGLAFQFLWNQAEPIPAARRKKLPRSQDRQLHKYEAIRTRKKQ